MGESRRHKRKSRRRANNIIRFGSKSVRKHQSLSGRKGKAFSKQLGSRRGKDK